jgi:DNA-binding transcriptional MerR regulator
VSSRTYLSIGDVLALLRQEFPDVTISKIRFLESQGLVNPERTPSGYRKFYEHDVERLRWVLRQQREHFLPLKVIKGRLDDEVAEFGDGAETYAPGEAEPVLVGRTSGPIGPRAAGRELPGFEAQATETRRGTDGGRSHPAAVPTAGSAATDVTQRRAAAAAASAASVAAAAARGAPSRPAPAARSTTAAPRGPGASTGRPPSPGASPAQDTGSGSGSGRAKEPARAPGAKISEATTAPAPDGVGPGLVERGAHLDGELVDELVGGSLSGATLTVGELAEGSGLDIAAVEQLESYGLVCGRVVGGVAYYDEDALIVARMAAGLARYGVEARHLRLHKHAAEREAGFIEQIVLPLLKQRNPEARQRAHEVVTELTLLGQGLREVLLRTTLRNQLGG